METQKPKIEDLKKERSKIISGYKQAMTLFSGLPDEQKKAMREVTVKKLADVLLKIAESDEEIF